MFSNLSKTARIMIVSVIAVCLVLLAAGLILLNLLEYFNVFDGNLKIEKNLPYIMGLTLGGVHSVIKVVMIEKGLNRVLDTEEKERASNMGKLLYMGRSVITAAVLAVGVIVPFFGLFGTIMGVLSLRIAAYVTAVIEGKNNKNIGNISEEG